MHAYIYLPPSARGLYFSQASATPTITFPESFKVVVDSGRIPDPSAIEFCKVGRRKEKE